MSELKIKGNYVQRKNDLISFKSNSTCSIKFIIKTITFDCSLLIFISHDTLQ